MADELDLETGDASRADARAERRRRRREAQSGKPPSARAEAAVETEIRSRLDRVFDRIVKARRARDDEELATIIEEDADAMAQGFLSLTHNVPFLRSPLIMALNILEPLLAFNRVGRVLFMRWYLRRAAKQEAQLAAQAEWEAAQNGEPAPMTAQ